MKIKIKRSLLQSLIKQANKQSIIRKAKQKFKNNYERFKKWYQQNKQRLNTAASSAALARQSAQLTQTSKSKDAPAPKGTNIRKVLKTRQEAGKQGRTWTELHNRINDKGQNSNWSNQNRGNNISAINRAAGRQNGYQRDGSPQKSPYQDQPLIKKNRQGKYIITKTGISKLRKLNAELGYSEDGQKSKKDEKQEEKKEDKQ